MKLNKWLLILISLTLTAQNKAPSIEKLLDSVENHFMFVDYNKSLELLEQTGLGNSKKIDSNLTKYYFFKSIIYSNTKGNNEEYYENANKAVTIAVQLNDYYRLTNLYMNFFNSQMELNLLDLASESINKAKFYALKDKDPSAILQLTISEADLHSKKSEFSKSNKILLEHEEEYIKDEDISKSIDFYTILSINFIYLNKLDSTFYNYEKLKNITINKEDAQYNYFNDYKNYFLKDLEFKIAEKIIDQDKSTYIDFITALLNQPIPDDIRLKESYFEVASSYYLKTNNNELHKVFHDSLINLIKSNASEGSKFMEESNLNVIKMQTILKKETRNKYIYISLIILIVVIVFLIIFFYNKKKKKDEALVKHYKTKAASISILEESNNKLKANLIGYKKHIEELKKETNNIANIKNSDLQKKKIKELHNTVKINEYNLFSIDKKHLEIIDGLNSKYFLNLRKEFPNLTSSEQLLCYFITMDFTNSDIASFLHVTIRSVEGKRYRISKKINPPKGETLKDFLSVYK